MLNVIIMILTIAWSIDEKVEVLGFRNNFWRNKISVVFFKSIYSWNKIVMTYHKQTKTYKIVFFETSDIKLYYTESMKYTFIY